MHPNPAALKPLRASNTQPRLVSREGRPPQAAVGGSVGLRRPGAGVTGGAGVGATRGGLRRPGSAQQSKQLNRSHSAGGIAAQGGSGATGVLGGGGGGGSGGGVGVGQPLAPSQGVSQGPTAPAQAAAGGQAKRTSHKPPQATQPAMHAISSQQRVVLGASPAELLMKQMKRSQSGVPQQPSVARRDDGGSTGSHQVPPGHLGAHPGPHPGLGQAGSGNSGGCGLQGGAPPAQGGAPPAQGGAAQAARRLNRCPSSSVLPTHGSSATHQLLGHMGKPRGGQQVQRSHTGRGTGRGVSLVEVVPRNTSTNSPPVPLCSAHPTHSLPKLIPIPLSTPTPPPALLTPYPPSPPHHHPPPSPRHHTPPSPRHHTPPSHPNCRTPLYMGRR